MKMRSKMIAEFLGTFALVFFGCGSIVLTKLEPQFFPAIIVPAVFGASVTVMIYAVGHISGAHFNPAVTMGFVVGRHFPLKEVLPYWISQFAGAIVAAILLRLLIPDSTTYGASLPQVGVAYSIAWEFVLTFFLMFVIVSVATDTRAVGTMAGAAIGLMVFLGALIGGIFTGASMNPARSLGPAIVEGHWENIFVYFVGPFLGAILAAWLYEKIRCEPSDNHSNVKGCC